MHENADRARFIGTTVMVSVAINSIAIETDQNIAVRHGATNVRTTGVWGSTFCFDGG